MPVEWVLESYQCSVKQEGGEPGPPLSLHHLRKQSLGMTPGSGSPKVPQKDTCGLQTPGVLQTNCPAKKMLGKGWRHWREGHNVCPQRAYFLKERKRRDR